MVENTVDLGSRVIRSMTAYANSQMELTNIGLLSCEIKSVNSRFLDLNFKLPDFLGYFETRIRKLISEKLKRGKVDIFCTMSFNSSIKLEQLYTQQLSEHLGLYKNIKQLSEEAGIRTQDLLITDVMRLLESKESSKNKLFASLSNDIKKDIENNLLDLIGESIIKLSTQRETEGAHLKAELLSILDELKRELKKLTVMLPEVITEVKQKYKSKIHESMAYLVSDIDCESEQEVVVKVSQEVVAYINKIDITEELARLKMHAQEAEKILNIGGVVGRKLDFLMQELMREANTLSAKSANIEFRNIAINLKVCIEQMREQIQNIE